MSKRGVWRIGCKTPPSTSFTQVQCGVRLETAAPLSANKSLTPELRDGVAEFDRKASHYIPVEQMKKDNYEAWQRLMRARSAVSTLNAFAPKW